MLNITRQFSSAFGLGNAIRKKRLSGTLRSLPLNKRKTEKILKSIGLAGGKRTTRKMKKDRKRRMTRRR